MKRIILGSGFGAILTIGLIASGCEATDDTTGADTAGKTSTGGGTNTGGNKGGNTSGGSTGTTGGSTGSNGGSTGSSGGSVQGGNAVKGGSTVSQGGSTVSTGGKVGGAASGGAAPGGAAPGGNTGTSGGTTSSQGGSTTPPDPETPTTYYKPRILVTTDGEVDDRSTFVRFLMYSTDYDVQGIVQVNSRYQKSGHSKEKWVDKAIGLYDQTHANLKIHHPGFPSASALLSVMKVGNENVGDLFVAPSSMSVKETAGSKHIIDTLLDGDPRHLHVPSWGGANTTAYALYTMKTTMPEKLAQVASKLWIYCIWYQDNGGQWIEDNIPEAHIYEAYRWDNIWDYQSLTGPNPADVKAYMTSTWLNANVKSGHGPLGAYTPQGYVSEGDTPSFLPLIDNGLYQHMNYTWGGWGGRPIFDKGNHMTDKGVTSDDGNEYKSFWRWIITLSNDFAGRMDWAVAKTYAEANHNPKARVVGALVRDVKGGETVTLDASPSTDPDGNNMTFLWEQYFEAGTASKVTITNPTEKTGASFTVPSEPGKKMHVILHVTDDGKPPMPNYQRIIFNIK